MSEEAAPASSILSRMKRYAKEAPFFCKIVELILCVIAVGLIATPFNDMPQEDINHIAIIYIALGGYILITTILILSHLMGERIPKKTAQLFSGMGAVLCCTAGLVLIRDWKYFPNNLISRYQDQYSDQIVSSGAFAILAALVFVADTYFVSKYG